MSPKKILFVNDNRSLLKTYEMLFADVPGVSFQQCFTIEQALRAITDSDAQVIFLDHHLTDNGNEGFEIIKRVSKVEGRTFYTTTGDHTVIPQYQKLGIIHAREGIMGQILQEAHAGAL